MRLLLKLSFFLFYIRKNYEDEEGGESEKCTTQNTIETTNNFKNYQLLERKKKANADNSFTPKKSF